MLLAWLNLSQREKATVFVIVRISAITTIHTVALAKPQSCVPTAYVTGYTITQYTIHNTEHLHQYTSDKTHREEVEMRG